MMSASSTDAMLVAHSSFRACVAWYMESTGLFGKGRSTAHGNPWMLPASSSGGLAMDRLHIASARPWSGLARFVGCAARLECARVKCAALCEP
eukprot:225558-Pyramimonas_sp.AAC.1